MAKIFVIKVAGGHEKNIADTIWEKVKANNSPIYSIIFSNKMKGYLLLESENVNAVANVTNGIKNIRSIVPGIMMLKDIQGIIKPTETEITFNEEQIVEVISGPFKGMKAKIIRFDKDKKEATVSLLDTPYQLQVTIDGNYLKPQ